MIRMNILLYFVLMPIISFSQINSAFIGDEGAKLKILAVNNNIISEDGYTQADSGNAFISIKVLLDNSDSHSMLVSNFCFLNVLDPLGCIYYPSLKSFVVREPHLVTMNILPGNNLTGWVTFEISQKLSAYALRIRYKQSDFLKSDWIPLWPSIINSERTKKLKKQVVQTNLLLNSTIKNIILIKANQTIDDYLTYASTSQISYVTDGIKHATQTKLFLNLLKRYHPEDINNRLSLLTDNISKLTDEIPKKIIEMHPLKNVKPLIHYLQLLKTYCSEK